MSRIHKHTIGPLDKCTKSPIRDEDIKREMRKQGAITTLLHIERMPNTYYKQRALQIYAAVSW